MGTLRLALALVVVVFHLRLLAGGPLEAAGGGAVQVFFLLSGFTMALVLGTRHQAGGLRAFYAGRLLRLLPAFLAVQALIVLLDPRRIPGLLSLLPPQSVAYVAVANLTMLGGDLSRAICFPTHRDACLLPVEGNLNGPAWSLGPELLFYLVAPFLIRTVRGAFLLTIIGAIYLHLTGLVEQPAAAIPFVAPWRETALSYAFFGASFVFFGLGALAWHVARGGVRIRPLPAIVVILLVIPIPTLLPGWLALVIAALVPPLSARTRRSRVDRFAGALSYPLYLVHVPLIAVVGVWAAGGAPFGGVIPPAAWTIGAALAAALALHLVVERPIDRLRHAPGFLRRLGGDATPDGAVEGARPSGTRPPTPRWAPIAVGAYLAFPFLLVAGIAFAQSRQTEVSTELALVEITDARWDRGVGRTTPEVLVAWSEGVETWLPYFARVTIGPNERWVHVTERTDEGLVVRLLWDPIPAGAPGPSVTVTRKVPAP